MNAKPQSLMEPITTSQPKAGTNSRVFKLWGASAATNLADGIFQVALSLLAVRLTRSPEAVAGVLLAARLPWLLLALHAGVIADRADRLRVLISTSLGRVILIGGLALLTLLSLQHIVVLYVVAFGLGVVETLFDTSVHSLLPMVVTPDRLERANSYMQSAELLMLQFIGPPLGGLLAGIAIWLACGTSASIYLAAVLLLLWVGGRYRPATRGTARKTVSREIQEGISFLWHHRLLRTLALTTGGLNIAFAAVMAVLPLYAVSPGPMKLSSIEYGLLLAAPGIGGLVAALLTTRIESWIGPGRLLCISVIELSLGFLIPALTTNSLIVAGGLILTGTTVFWNIVTVSLRQRIVPDHVLGRVNASYRLCAYGALPVGASLDGFVGHVWGLPAVFVLSSALAAITLVPIVVLTRSGALSTMRSEER